LRAGTEPFFGLNASWPALDPHSRSHFSAAALFFAPTGRVKVSDRKL